MSVMFASVACVLLVHSTPAPLPSLAVMPVVIRNGGGQEQRTVLTSVLTGRLAEQGMWAVLSMDEVEDLLKNEQDRQAVGCSDDSCMAELAGALGARFLVTGDVVPLGDSLLWTASLLDQGTSSVLQRATVRGRTMQALVMQAEDMAAALAGRQEGTGLVGVASQKRLGFKDAAGLAEFKTYREKRAEDPLPDVLTTFILERNGESRVLALAEAVAFGTALVMFAVTAAVMATSLAAVAFFTIPMMAVAAALTPVVMVSAALALAAGITGFSLVVLDALDLGRVPVDQAGCCRNDPDIVEAEALGPVDRAPGWVALAGVLAPFVGLSAVAIPSLVGQAIAASVGAGTALSTEERQATILHPAYAPLSGIASMSWWCCACLLPWPVCVGAPAGLLMLLWPRKPLLEVDDVAPVPTRSKEAA